MSCKQKEIWSTINPNSIDWRTSSEGGKQMNYLILISRHKILRITFTRCVIKEHFHIRNYQTIWCGNVTKLKVLDKLESIYDLP